MDVREKLVEIIQNSVGGCARHWAEVIADGLIANGVTVQEWISVDDRLPEFGVSVLARCFYHGKWRTLVCHTSKENFGGWYTDEVCQWVKVTHWMPLPPELPKEEADNETVEEQKGGDGNG